MLAGDLLLVVISLLPRVENPWPESIGLELPIVMAGVGGVVANVLYASASKAQRDGAVRYGGLGGFGVGTLFYLLSLLDQVVSG